MFRLERNMSFMRHMAGELKTTNWATLFSRTIFRWERPKELKLLAYVGWRFFLSQPYTPFLNTALWQKFNYRTQYRKNVDIFFSILTITPFANLPLNISDFLRVRNVGHPYAQFLR